MNWPTIPRTGSMFPDENRKEIEKELALAPGQRPATTYFQQAQIEPELGGRFAAVKEYPPMPPDNPWRGATPEPIEPPLGYSIDDQIVNGERHEIELAARILEERKAKDGSGTD